MNHRTRKKSSGLDLESVVCFRPGKTARADASNQAMLKRLKPALLLIDVINHFDFPDGDRILEQAFKIAPGIARFKSRARAAGIPTIYVNDNFGEWRSERSALLKALSAAGCKRCPIC